MCSVFVLLLVLWSGATGLAYGQDDALSVAEDTSESASASVVTLAPEALLRDAPAASVEVLRAVPGVGVAQTGLGQHEVALRGTAGLFHDAPLVLVDGRPAELPGLGANVFALMPIQRVDLKRIEVTRGPAAAHYGPAAHAGAIHFITKNPFDDPGTTAAVSGGTRHYVSSQLRHASDVGGTFGYEATAYLARGRDWRLDPSHPADRQWLAHDYVFDKSEKAEDHQHVDPSTGRLQRDEEVQKIGIHGRLAYRLGARTTIAAQGGYLSMTGRMLSEAGALQANYLGYAFGQVQLQSGGLHAQLVLNNNESGNSYLYGTNQSIMDRGVRYVAEARYRFAPFRGAGDATLGTMASWTRPRTDGTLMGRHEEHDAINAYGAYAQAETALSPRLDLALALRGDVDNLGSRVHLAPHAQLTYVLAPSHTLHLRYDRAVAPPRADTHFMDAEVRRQALAGPYAWVHRARGAGEGFTFDRFRSRGEAAWLLPMAEPFGRPVAADALPLDVIYRAASAHFDRLLADTDLRPDPAEALSDAQRHQLVTALHGLASEIAPEAVARGELGLPQGSGGYVPVEVPLDVPPLQRPVTQAAEFGYRGPLSRRVQLAASAYYVCTKNAVAPLQVAAPAVYTPALAEDMHAALEPALARAAVNPDAALGTLLKTMGMTATEAARLAADLTAQVFADRPVATVQPDQVLLPDGAPVTESGTLLTYRNVDRVAYAGMDARLQARLTEGLRVFGAASLVTEARSSVPSAHRARNAPAFRGRIRIESDVAKAWSLQATGRYATRFPVRAGLYDGTVPAAYPVDLGVHYDARRHVRGLHVELTVQNLFNQRYRAFAGAPTLGRMARAHLTYTL